MKKENKIKLISKIFFATGLILILVNSIFFGSKFGTLFYSVIFISILVIVNINKVYLKQRKNKTIKIIRNTINLTFLLFIISFLLIQILIVKEFYFKEDTEDYVEYVVILGAGLEGDKVSKRLEQRLLEGVDYLTKNETSKVIVSGGKGDDEYISEAEAMGRYLIENGIDKNRIYYENKSTSTLENLLYSRKILCDDLKIEDSKIIIITNDYHMFRAKMISQKLQIQSYGITSKSELSFKVNSLPREYFAIIKDYLLLEFDIDEN